MTQEAPLLFRRFDRPPWKTKVGDLIVFDDRGRMFEATKRTLPILEFSYAGHVVEIDETGMLIATDMAFPPAYAGRDKFMREDF